MSTVAGVIPARWGSTRFPGKILAPLCGKPLIQWVWERAQQATKLDHLLVATDDERIADVVQQFGGKAIMTRSDHPSGTDRIAEAIAALHVDAAVNIQGDEPLIDPGLIDKLASSMVGEGAWDMATAATPITDPTLVGASSVVKVVCDAEQRALYFSRSPIPYIRDPNDPAVAHIVYLRHIGVYAYRAAFLGRLVATPPAPLELAEKLEQLRALHLGARIRVLIADNQALGVDEPGDVPAAEAALREAGLCSVEK